MQGENHLVPSKKAATEGENRSSYRVASGFKSDLRRVLGIAFGLSLGVSSAIGVGILRTPALVANELTSPMLFVLVWLCVTIYVLIDANSNAELTAMLPEAGGPYVFARHAFGEFPSFVVGWVDWVINVATIAFVATAFVDFLTSIWPDAEGIRRSIIALLITITAGLHWAGVSPGGKAQLGLGLLKVTGFLIVIFLCLCCGSVQTASVYPNSALAPHGELSFLAGAFALVRSWQLVQETYAGATNAVYLAEESSNPSRNMPLAVFGSVLIVALVYLSNAFILLHVLGQEQLATSTLPLADAAALALGPAGKTGAVVVVLISLTGTLSANIMFTPRILFAISRDGLTSRIAATINRRGTPGGALLVTVAVALLLALTNTFDQLFSITAFLGLTTVLVVNSGLFALRWRSPEYRRPFRAWGYPIVPAIAVVVPASVIVGAVVADTRNALIGLILILLAFPALKWVQRQPYI